MCLSCLIVDVKRVKALTRVDTIGMRSKIHAGRHGPRKNESCFMACFMLYVIYVTFHALVHALCLASCLASCSVTFFKSTPEFMHDVSCFACHASFRMLYVMLLRVMFYGMLDAPYPMSFMSYRVKASTSADIVGMRLQERSMKADADQGNLILASYHVSFTSYR